MKKIIVFSMILAAACTMNVVAQKNNTLTAKEKKEGWVLLFDGKNFGGWRSYNATSISPLWTIDEEAMRVASRAERPPRVEGAPRPLSGDIIYGSKKYKNFELSIDWKVAKGANSGIFYYVQELPDRSMPYSAPEIQILDNWNAPDNKLTNHLAGSLYDMLPALPQNARPHGQWNTVVIRVKDGHVTHTQNGVKVCEYTLWSPEWAEMVANSKFKDWEYFKNGPSRDGGYIGLQDHNDNNVWYRNIKIREL